MTRIRFFCVTAALVGFLATQAAAAPTRPELGGTGCSNPTTVAGLADYEKDGALCQVQDGASTSDCDTGGGSEVVLCCYDGSAWSACGGAGGGGSGDIESVGDCSTGECFSTSGTGNILYFEGTTVDGNDTVFQAADPTSDRIIELPNESGTICTTGSVCPGYSDTSHTHTLGSDDDDDWFTTDSVSNVLIFEGSITVDDAYETTFSGADVTADRTVTMPDQSGTVCVNDSTTSGCGNITNSAATTDNAVVAWTGTGGKTVENTECVMEDVDGDGANDYTVCPEGFEAGDQGCANNADCNFISLQKNDGGGAPTCTTMVAGNSDLTDQLFMLPKSDDSVVLCDGTTEVGTVAATSSGDVSAVGAGCASGACFTDTVVTSGTTMFVWEGSTSDGFEYTWSVTNADVGADYTYTWPNVTGTVSINPTGCTGTSSYADGAGNCDTIDGVEDLETATDDAVIVGDGSVFTSKVLTDADAPSTSVAGTTIHYDTTTNAFSASAIPTVDQWAPGGFLKGNPASFATTGDEDECNCWKMPVLQPIADLDDATLITDVALDANDVLELGVYSEDGDTQYFECAFTSTATGVINCAAAPTANGKVLQPGDYWICVGTDDGGDTTAYALEGYSTNQIQTCRFTQACASGEMPDTLTSEACTFSTSVPPIVMFRNE